MRKQQPKPYTKADVAAMTDERLAQVVAAGGACLFIAHNPKLERMFRRLMNNHDLAQAEIERRRKAAH